MTVGIRATDVPLVDFAFTPTRTKNLAYEISFDWKKTFTLFMIDERQSWHASKAPVRKTKLLLIEEQKRQG